MENDLNDIFKDVLGSVRKRGRPPLYSRHPSMDMQICYYCDEPGNQEDHWPPKSWLPFVGKNAVKLLIRCCGICNVVLSNSNQRTLAERKRDAILWRDRKRSQRPLDSMDIARLLVLDAAGIDPIDEKSSYDPFVEG